MLGGAHFQERADIVLIDAPPLIGLSDARTISAKVDGLIVIARLSTLKRAILDELRRALEGAPTVKLGFVLTGVSTEEAYGYGYASDYGIVAPERELEPVR